MTSNFIVFTLVVPLQARLAQATAYSTSPLGRLIGTSNLFKIKLSLQTKALLLPRSSQPQYMATPSFHLRAPRSLQSSLTPLFLSYPTSDVSTQPVCSTFRSFLESDHFLPPRRVGLIQGHPPASHLSPSISLLSMQQPE